MSKSTLAAGATLALVLVLPLSLMPLPAPLAQEEEWRAGDDMLWSARSFIGAETYDATGAPFGEVVDLVLGPEGSLQALVVAEYHFFLAGHRPFLVPLEQAHLAAMDRVELLVGEAALQPLPQTADAAAWPVSALLSDEVLAADGSYFGWIDDVIFDQRGRISAVLVEQDLRAGHGGRHALPFDAAYRPGEGFSTAGDRRLALAGDEASIEQHGLPQVASDHAPGSD